MLTSLTLSRGYLAHFRNIWNSAFETCRCPDVWNDETGCRRMPAQPTQPPKLCPPDKPCPPTSRLGHNPPLPTTTRYKPPQSDSTHQRLNGKLQLAILGTQRPLALSHRKMFWEVFFKNVFIQMHTNVGEQTQPQMFKATVLILEARDQKDEQLLSEN